MKSVPRKLIKVIAAGLKQTFEDGRYADQVLERLLSTDPKLGSRDRRFIAEHFYDMVRYWRRLIVLEEIAELDDDADFYLKTGLWLAYRGMDLSDHEEFADLPFQELANASFEEEQLYIRESLPDWLHQLGLKELPDRWEAEVQGLNQPAPTYIRANRLKATAEQVKQVLHEEGVEAHLLPNFPDALQLEGRTNVIRLGSFRKGLYEVQDASSQLIAPFVDPQPGETVVDACAGAGGKTLHLAALMQDKGKIVSMDVEAWKLDELRRRASRAGIKSVDTRLIDSRRVIRNLEDSAHRVLLDVPCSGLGVLRRNPDAKWKLTEEHIDNVRETQAEILQFYSRMVKKGGTLVYATCSILPSEDEKQVARFLEETKGFEFEEDRRTWPSEGFDGFYMARFKRVK